MDTFITVISWIAGFYAAFILLLSIGFSAGGHANTGNAGLGMISIVSTLLFLFLIYLGGSSLFSTDDANVSTQVKSEKVEKIEPIVKEEKEQAVFKIQNSQDDN